MLLSWRVTSPCPLGDHTSVVEGSDGSCGILVSLSSQGADPIVHTRDRECPCLTLHGQSCPHSCKEQECLCPEGSPQRDWSFSLQEAGHRGPACESAQGPASRQEAFPSPCSFFPGDSLGTSFLSPRAELQCHYRSLEITLNF